jgi:lactate dehydrogenase-like 2-hydroxyacid dehydrogenase
VVNSEKQAISASKDAEIILGHRYLKQVLPYAKKLKWVQSTGGGYDHLPWKYLIGNNILLTRVTFSSDTIAQHAVMLALALNRKLPKCIDYQRKKRWGRDLYEQLLPRPRIALILGFGSIGKAIARILHSMDIEVWGVKRTEDKFSKSISEKLFVDNSWQNELHKIDFCFLALPNETSTKNILSPKLLNKMSEKAIIINIARGELIDTDELCKLLREGKIGGAGLDIFEGRKPLPEDSSVWETPNLIVTPYLAARYGDRGKDLEEFVELQIKRYFNNEKLLNIVE